MPILPLAKTVSKVEPVDDEMVSNGEEPAAPWRVKVDDVEVVPTDNLRLVLSQLNRLVALKAPAVPANWMLPGVPEARVGTVVPVIVMVPADEVAMVMLAPAAKFPTCQLEPLLINNWPLVVGAVEIPVPPLAMES